MTTPVHASQLRGIDYSLPNCGEVQCNGRGTCLPPPPGVGVDLMCDCNLGYKGEFCEDTVNGALSIPLTLSMIGIIIGLLTLAFVLAKLRQKQKKRRRREVAEKATI